MAAPWLDSGLSEAIKSDKDFVNKCHDIASDIESQSIKIVTLVERLGPVLTNTETELRERGTHILSGVLQHLPQDFLHEQELDFIVRFFCDRLNDHHSIIPAVLKGILAIAHMNNLPDGAACTLLTKLFLGIHCQGQTKSDRNIIYQIIRTFTSKKCDELKQLGPDLVYGVIQAIDGERDPDNLMLLFGMLPTFVRTFPPGHLVEEFFEVMSCYFPVDFNAQVSDARAVTRDSLATTLCSCLIATQEFAQFCLPLVLEKLDSTLRVAKLDSLHLLQAACSVFPVSAFRPHLPDIWRSLAREVLPGTDRDVRQEGLCTLARVVRLLSASPMNKEEAALLPDLVHRVLSATETLVVSVELSMFLPSVKMLVTVAEASHDACREIVLKVVPLLLSQVQCHARSDEQVSLLRALTSLLSVCVDLNVALHKLDVWTNVPGNYLSTARPPSSTEVRVEGLRGLKVTFTLLSEEDRRKLYELLCDVLTCESEGPLRTEALECLRVVAHKCPEEVVEDAVLGRLLNWQDGSDGDIRERAKRCTSALAVLASLDSLMPFTAPQLLDWATDPRYPCELRSAALCSVANLAEAAKPHLLTYLYSNCAAVSRLASWGVHTRQTDCTTGDLNNCARAVAAVTRAQNSAVQSDIATVFVPQFLDPAAQPAESGAFSPLDPSSSPHMTRAVVLLEALLGCLHPEVTVPHLPHLVSALSQLAVHTADAVTQESTARLVAVLINKAPPGDELSGLLACVHSAVTPPPGPGAVHLLAWVTRGLVLRGHEEADHWLGSLTDLLSSEPLGRVAADEFRLLMAPPAGYLSTDSHATVRLLYRQRLFLTAPSLVERFKAADIRVRANYLVVVGHLLSGVPRVVIVSSLSEILPMLVESLEQEEPVLLLSTLETLRDLLEEKLPGLEEHCQTFIPRMLRLSQFKGAMNVRIAALQCLVNFCKYPIPVLLPFKTEVVRELGKCLDDPKRLVRRQAVSTRSRWFLIGSPGEPTNT